eukprot:3499343-Pyramimonas_sp.AAC.1
MQSARGIPGFSSSHDSAPPALGHALAPRVPTMKHDLSDETSVGMHSSNDNWKRLEDAAPGPAEEAARAAELWVAQAR